MKKRENMVKRAVLMICALSVCLAMTACGGGDKPLSKDEYAIYEDNKKIGVLGEDGIENSVSFKSLQSSEFKGKELSTKQKLKIGSSVDDLLTAYKGRYMIAVTMNLAKDSVTLFDECNTVDSFVEKYKASNVTGEYNIHLYTIVLKNNKSVSQNGWKEY